MDSAGLERLAGIESRIARAGSGRSRVERVERVEIDEDGVGMVVVGDDPGDRGFGDEKGGLIADDKE